MQNHRIVIHRWSLPALSYNLATPRKFIFADQEQRGIIQCQYVRQEYNNDHFGVFIRRVNAQNAISAVRMVI
jgi:hypothetical protein